MKIIILMYFQVRESVACVYIYFSELTYEEISETPSISTIDLIANMGGCLGSIFRSMYSFFFGKILFKIFFKGLNLGFSALSIIEIIELVIDIIFILIERLKRELLFILMIKV